MTDEQILQTFREIERLSEVPHPVEGGELEARKNELWAKLFPENLSQEEFARRMCLLPAETEMPEEYLR